MKKINNFKKSLIGIKFFMMVAFAVLCFEPIQASAATIVTADVLNVRSGAGTEYSRVGTVRQGMEVVTVSKVTGSDGYTWYHISGPVEGYVRGDYLSNVVSNDTVSVSGGSGTVIADILNVRSGPGTNYSKLGTIKEGAKVGIISKSGSWYNITCTINGLDKTGYVHSDYIQVIQSSDNKESESTPETESSAESESIPETESNAESESDSEIENDTPEETIVITGIVNCDALNVRSGASTSSSKIGMIYRNEKVEIISQTGSWYQVSCTIGGAVKSGYVYAEYITKTETSNNTESGGTDRTSGIVNCDVLNVRSEASTSSSKIGLLYRNAKVEIISQTGSWYQVNCTIGGVTKSGYVYAEYITKVNSSDISNGTGIVSSYRISDFPVICQNPELPTGCEITSLTMALRYAGYSVSKTTMASKYLPKQPYTLTIGSDGKKYGPDLDYYFVGNPYGTGTICGAEALVTAGDQYLEDCGSSLRVNNITGCSFEELYKRVSQDQPVVVLVTIGMANRWSTTGWYTTSGKYVEYSRNDHASVLIGYTDTKVTVVCPIYGIRTYSRTQFEKVFASRGYQAVVLE